MKMTTGEDILRRKRIVAIATQIVASQIEKGEIEATDEAIKKAMPEAIATAKAAYNAAVEFISG